MNKTVIKTVNIIFLNRFWRKEEEDAKVVEATSVPGCELTRELEDAWNLYTRVSIAQ
jgi:hypothetical protein